MTVDLRPSFLRTLGIFFFPLAALSTLSYLFAAPRHALPVRDALIGVILFSTLAAAFFWVFCVPRRLEFSETELTIKPALGRLQTLEWDELEYFGPAGGLFLVQFFGRSPFIIFTLAFPRAEWRRLKRFLYDNFPECIASGSIGGHLFKWRK